MVESILDSIKAQLGYGESTDYDTELIIFINTAFAALNQLGAGPTTGFSISSNVEKWNQFLGERTDLEFIKSYIFLKVKLMFDPPNNSFLVDAIKTQISELEFRILTQVTPVVKSTTP